MASDEEEGRYRSFYQDPVQSTDAETRDVRTGVRAEQVVGVDSPSSRVLVVAKSLPATVENATVSLHPPHHPEPGSLKNVISSKSSSPLREVTETTRLIRAEIVTNEHINEDGGDISPLHTGSSETCWDSGRHKKNCFFLSSTLFVTILFVLAMITPVLYYKYRSLGDLKKTVSILNVNDTIIAAKIDPEEKSQVALQLISKTIQHFHIVNLYSTPCNRLMSYMQLGHSAGNFTLNGATKILFPTYFVEGSKIEIEGYILRASTMTVEIELYIFNGLKHVQDFAANLDKRAYEATIYIKGGGPQNTSTPVNYTVPSTDYYFIVLCATAPIYAEFDMTLHKQVYNTSDYSLSCVIEDSTRCSLTYDFHDKQECILAHVVYVPDLEWTPPDIHVTAHPRRNTSTSIFVMSCVGSICFLCIIILLTILFGFCCCKGLLRKRTHYHYIPISSDSM